MGCGRVGSTIAQELDKRGYSVAVIDKNESAFKRISSDFSGLTVKGIGFDRGILEAAKIQEAAGFAAVSSGDNTNILAARTVREIYRIENTVARIYDPGRADIYERLGISTVATVKWAANQVMRHLLPEQLGPLWRDNSDNVRLIRLKVNSNWAGHRITEMSEIAETPLPFIIRLGEGLVPKNNTVFQEGDLLLAACDTRRIPDVETCFLNSPDTN